MEYFVTLFNSLYLPQGLALHKSLERHVTYYVLWILCVDDEAYNVLEKLALKNVRLLKLTALETEELIAVRGGRTIGEYCWTLTPFSVRFVFEADTNVNRVTYLDADVWFRKHPRPIFDELDSSGKHVLLTDHAYAAEYDQSATSGQYCVQFMTFTRTEGEPVRKLWEEQCVEWCFARVEDGKFGDQKYLDDWPERFSSLVHVLENKEYALAPWNAVRFPYGNSIFYHFHGLKILSRKNLQMVQYSLPHTLRKNVYQPYFNDLKAAISQLDTVQFSCRPQAQAASLPRRLYRRVKLLYKGSQAVSPPNIFKW